MSDEAKVTCQVSAYQLELSDLRRLVSETSFWSPECYVDVLNNGHGKIVVTELGTDRRKAAAKTAPAAAAKKANL